MKRELLKFMGLSKPIIDQIMSTYGADIEKYKRQLSQYRLENLILQEKLIQSTLQIGHLKYECAVQNVLNQYYFTSELVKESVIHALHQKKFSIKNGRLLGADEYIKNLLKQDSDDFEKSSDSIRQNTTSQFQVVYKPNGRKSD